MDLSNLGTYSIVDGHIHYGHPDFMSGLMAVMDEIDIPKFNVVCTAHQSRLSLVPDALHLKAHYPERVYVFGGLDIAPLFIAPDQLGNLLASYVDTLRGLGCDGVKMLEGKPDIRRTMPIPDFDSQAYAPYWERMAEKGVPLVFHVNDPEEFWDADLVPDWASQQGWFYGDGNAVDNEDQYRQVLNVLERHPDLKVIFAHFFFLSAQLERLGEYFERYPNMHVDLTPGIEMYRNFSMDPGAARQFFIKYQDRIVYGTDIGAKAQLVTPELGIEAAESMSRVYVVRNFLETGDEFWLERGLGFLSSEMERPFQGIALPGDALEMIYSRNFERLAGPKPAALNPKAIVAECERLEATACMIGAALPDTAPDTSVAEMVKAFFKARL